MAEVKLKKPVLQKFVVPGGVFLTGSDLLPGSGRGYYAPGSTIVYDTANRPDGDVHPEWVLVKGPVQTVAAEVVETLEGDLLGV